MVSFSIFTGFITSLYSKDAAIKTPTEKPPQNADQIISLTNGNITRNILRPTIKVTEAVTIVHDKIDDGDDDEKGAAETDYGDGSWFFHQQKPWWALLVIWILKLGPIPRHIAFVMDGNRRYAKARQYSSVLKGHVRGFEQLTKVLDWCDWFDVREITVYAFSIENFKRSNEEVDGLMALAERKLSELLNSREKLAHRQLGIRFFGNRALLSERIQHLMMKIEALSRHRNCRAFLNICLAYTSTDEITRAFEAIRSKVRSDQIKEDQIDMDTINAHLDTQNSFPLDMLIRTSEKRLSDFMLYQIRASTYIHFEPNVLWPDFSLWHIFRSLVHFQMARIQLAQRQQERWFPRMEEEEEDE